MSEYNVFISWSREPSKSVAFVVKKWLKQVIQSSNAFMSEADIESGEVGLQVIADQLESIKVGVFCVTVENQSRPWLNYEAGAISKGKRGNKVIPLLFDLEGNDLEQPLAQFQYKSLFNQDEMLQFTKDVARALAAPIDGADLDEAFERCWPDLNEKLMAIKESQSGQVRVQSRTTSDKMDEVLQLIRSLSNQMTHLQTSTWFRSESPLTSVFARTEKPVHEESEMIETTRREIVSFLIGEADGLAFSDLDIAHGLGISRSYAQRLINEALRAKGLMRIGRQAELDLDELSSTIQPAHDDD